MRRGLGERRHVTAAGRGTICTKMAALVDTNILVYRFDRRFPEKQRIATELLRKGIADDSIRVPHQAVVEFVSVVTRPIDRGRPLLPLDAAFREAEELVGQFPLLYPNEAIVRTALRGAAAYHLAWFDAHLWAYAEYYGLEELISEDFQHDRMYGSVRALNPFVAT
jgi:predicted nucleic acid-binding protein